MKKATPRKAEPAATVAAAGAQPGAPELSERQRRHLRGLAHPLKPVVRLGNAGLTEAVARETERALADHELIGALATRTASALVHRIGNVAVLYRPHPQLPRILIPD